MPSRPITRLRLAVVTVVAAMAASCGSSVEPEANGPMLQTDALAYAAQTRDGRLVLDIPYLFENRTGRDLFMSNCNGHVPPSLERKVGPLWVTAYAPVVPLCLSDPIFIDAGADYRDTFRIDATPDDLRLAAGAVYRLYWNRPAANYDSATYHGDGTVPAVPHPQISNTFRIDF